LQESSNHHTTLNRICRHLNAIGWEVRSANWKLKQGNSAKGVKDEKEEDVSDFHFQ
jgi:hypothetical protein